MERIVVLAKLLPTLEDIKTFLVFDEEAELVLPRAIKNISKLVEGNCRPTDHETINVSGLITTLAENMWDMLYDNSSDLPQQYNKAFGVTLLFKIIYMLFKSGPQDFIDKTLTIFDEAFMMESIPADLYPGFGILHKQMEKFFVDSLAGYIELELHVIPPIPRKKVVCDFFEFECPSVETFRKNCFRIQQPSLLINTINHWPAISKWRDLNYIMNVAGNRTVIVDMGSTTAKDSCQYKIKVYDFLIRQFATGARSLFPIEHLNGQKIFDQIVLLKEDICVPDYCSVGVVQSEETDIRAWMGPENTVTSLHRDSRNNLLCQVFGNKKLLLAPPDSASNLYLLDELPNSSRVDVEDINVDCFPLVLDVDFYHVTLQEGDCLYIPPGWFYYARSLSDSFSVGFLWN